MKEKESIISKQERAAKQQELLEKKRRAKAEYNTSSVKPVRGMTQRAPVRKETEKPAAGVVKKPDVRPEKKPASVSVKKRDDKSVKNKLLISENAARYASISQWFLSICWLKIPVIGFIYALILAFNHKTPYDKKNFARGYLLYRILVLLLSLTILFVLYRVGLDFIDQMLSYVKV